MISRLSLAYFYIKTLLLYSWRFKRIGKKSIIFNPLRIDGHKNIVIGNNVRILDYTWLACMPLTINKTPILSIGNGVNLGHFNHIYATSEIIIEDSVLTADKVYISDNLHEYSNTKLPVLAQPIKQMNKVIIGQGSWIGENVCIIGAKIGKQSVVGANSVVLDDIPDYSVAVGIPARVIKKYDTSIGEWKKTNLKGEFI